MARFRNIAVTLVGIAIFVILLEVNAIARAGLFEVDHPTLFARLETLWSLLLFIVPGFEIGFYVTKKPVLLGAIACGLGESIGIYRSNFYGYRAIGDFLPERQYMLYALQDILIWAAIGGAMAWTGAWLRRRLTIGWSDRGQRLR
jgi:hypothetical protein